MFLYIGYSYSQSLSQKLQNLGQESLADQCKVWLCTTVGEFHFNVDFKVSSFFFKLYLKRICMPSNVHLMIHNN